MKRTPNSAGGAALGSVLLCLAVAVALLYVAVSGSLSHLMVVKNASQREHAKNLAESAISRAVEQLVESDYTWGANGTDRIEVTFEGLKDADGLVSFNKSELPKHYSTTNLQNDQTVVGAGGTAVPANSVHIVSRGRVGGVERWIECIYHKPPYPDGLVASGPIEASGLVLSGVRKGEDYQGGDPQSIPPEDRVLANLFSNAAHGPSPGLPSISLGPGCHINGTVGTAGQIKVEPMTVIKGELLPFSQARPLPSLSIADRISVLTPNSVDVASLGGDLQLNKSWFNHANGGLHVGGNLHLNGSALTVNGPLVVDGAVKGLGVILVDGSVDIRNGGSSIQSTDQVAIGATGDVTLQASGPEGNYFQGLVYTEGNLTARDITVVGTVVVHGKNGSKGSATLDNVRLVRTPASVNVRLQSMKGVDHGSRSGALSFTVTPAPDGETYLCSARLVMTKESDITAADNDRPIVWESYGDQMFYKEWQDFNLGKPGPDFGRALGIEIGNAVASFAEGNSGKWKQRYLDIVMTDLKALLEQKDQIHSVSLALNNLLAEDFGESRFLLWRPFKPK
jgi:hypothetical protein